MFLHYEGGTFAQKGSFASEYTYILLHLIIKPVCVIVYYTICS
jgi:hypothetical protein